MTWLLQFICKVIVFSEMGVRGLTSFVKSIESLWTTVEVKNAELVIDGSALCNSLYSDNGFDRQCGGQYQEFYDIIVSFFKVLDSSSVESFVVLDGAHDSSDKKLDTFKKRAKERIQTADMLAKNPKLANPDVFVCPLLLNLVFVKALRDLGIKFAFSDW